jgi:hypothetical protein
VEFEVLLVGFEREGYWQHMDWAPRWALAERIKAKGNALFRDKRYAAATSRYTHLLRLVESTRDYEAQEQVDAADALKRALLTNLALAAFHMGEHARCIEWCDKALTLDPDSAKVGCVVWCLCCVWCGVAWRGVVWCGVVWHGVAWCGVVWRDACCGAWQGPRPEGTQAWPEGTPGPLHRLHPASHAPGRVLSRQGAVSQGRLRRGRAVPAGSGRA